MAADTLSISDHVICHLACAPMRAAGNHRSEQTHQLLFAEVCEILELGPVFCRARCLYEGYEGWIDQRQFRPWHGALTGVMPGSYLVDDVAASAVSAQRTLWLPRGCHLPEYAASRFTLGTERFQYHGNVHQVRPAEHVAELINYARRYLHMPYAWGGRTPWGIDCSGFVQQAFRAFTISLPRDCSQQCQQGAAVPLTDICPGDVVFFQGVHNPSVPVDHVGLVTELGRVIHACAQVREDQLDATGIWTPTGELTHRLVSARRFTTL